MDRLLEELIRKKAKAMMKAGDYRSYAKTFAQEINDLEKAFLAGAIDAMSFDVGALNNPRRLPSLKERKNLIRELLEEPPSLLEKEHGKKVESITGYNCEKHSGEELPQVVTFVDHTQIIDCDFLKSGICSKCDYFRSA